MVRLGGNRSLVVYPFLLGCMQILPCFGQWSWYVNEAGKYLASSAVTGVVFCKVYECCSNDWIISNTSGLALELDKRFYGQHLVKRAVINHLKGHVRGVDPSKALVLSFHGPQGTGKNHVSRIIAEALYSKGLQSEYVRLISVPATFPHKHMVDSYKDYLQKLIENQVKKCPRSLFIFDDVDKMPQGLMDIIKPYLDYHYELERVDYRRAIFLFLSNSGSTAITEYVLDQLISGREREDIKLNEVEVIVSRAAINSEGLWHSELIGSHLVTAFLPFLPLERRHVVQCIHDALLTKKYYSSPREIPRAIEQEVMEELMFYPRDKPWFSVTGCKRVAEKVDYIMLN